MLSDLEFGFDLLKGDEIYDIKRDVIDFVNKFLYGA